MRAAREARPARQPEIDPDPALPLGETWAEANMARVLDLFPEHECRNHFRRCRCRYSYSYS